MSGDCINDRTEKGFDYYPLDYNIPQLSTGLYFMVVYSEKEYQAIELVIVN
jgi:hypothetical protein